MRAFILLSFSLFFGGRAHLTATTSQHMQSNTYWKWKSPLGTYALHYIEKGSGPEHVLFLHGYAAHTYTWKHQLDVFAKRGYHVWAIDLVGFGLSDKPVDIEYSLAFFQEQVLAFLKEHKIQHIHLIGNSMGGGVALSLAVSHPEKVSSLALIDPLAYPIDLPFPYSLGRRFGKLLVPFFSRTLILRTLKRIVHNAREISPEQVDAYWAPYCTKGGREAVLRVLKSFDRTLIERLSQSYPSIKAPVLILWGREDRWIPVEHSKRLADQIATASQYIIESCGHIPQEEKPEEVNRYLFEFLDAVRLKQNE